MSHQELCAMLPWDQAFSLSTQSSELAQGKWSCRGKEKGAFVFKLRTQMSPDQDKCGL